MRNYLLVLICAMVACIACAQQTSHNVPSADYAAISPQGDDFTPAPGRGILEGTKDSIKTQPVLFDFEKMEFKPFKLPNGETLAGVKRKTGAGANFKNTWWELKKGAVLPVHSHQMEQVNHVLSGKVAAYSQGKKYILVPGKYLFLLPNVPHEFVAEEDSILEDMQTGGIGNYTGGFN